MLVVIDALTKKVAAEPLKDRLASTTAADMRSSARQGSSAHAAGLHASEGLGGSHLKPRLVSSSDRAARFRSICSSARYIARYVCRAAATSARRSSSRYLEPVVQALGLEHRVASSQARAGGCWTIEPQGWHVRLRPHGELLQEPYLHAPEGRQRKLSLSTAAAVRNYREAKRELGISFFPSSVRLREDLTELRHPQAENSVLFNALPGSLAISVDDLRPPTRRR